MLHYNNINGCAYLFYVPTFYLLKAYNKLHKDAYTPSKHRDDVPSNTYLEIIFKMALYGMTDYFISRTLPNLIFGTHALNYIMDFFFKKGLFLITLCVLINSPFEDIIRRKFRGSSYK